MVHLLSRAHVSRDWKRMPPVFPSIGRFHQNFSEPWKNLRGIFQGLENIAPTRRLGESAYRKHQQATPLLL
jgi:hypothetical protein